MAKRFDDICELGELSGGDDLVEPSPKRARYKYSIQRIGNQSGHLFLTNPITFHNYMDFNSTPPGFHYEIKGFFFTDLNIFLPN